MKKTLNQCKQAIVGFCAMGIACTGMAQTNYNVSEKQILDVMKTATRFMMETVSYKGGFVWNYLPDMSRSWGELEARPFPALHPGGNARLRPGSPASGMGRGLLRAADGGGKCSVQLLSVLLQLYAAFLPGFLF